MLCGACSDCESVINITSCRYGIDMDDFQHPVSHFKTFNEFFIRELKPKVRPIFAAGMFAGRD
jgi:phosphatidylserine decarboxylase